MDRLKQQETGGSRKSGPSEVTIETERPQAACENLPVSAVWTQIKQEKNRHDETK